MDQTETRKYSQEALLRIAGTKLVVTIIPDFVLSSMRMTAEGVLTITKQGAGFKYRTFRIWILKKGSYRSYFIKLDIPILA